MDKAWTVYAYFRKDNKPAHERTVYTLVYYAVTMEEALDLGRLSTDYEPVAAELYGESERARSASAVGGFAFTRERLDFLLQGGCHVPTVFLPKAKVKEPAKPVGLPPEANNPAPYFNPSQAWRATRIAAGDPPPGE